MPACRSFPIAESQTYMYMPQWMNMPNLLSANSRRACRFSGVMDFLAVIHGEDRMMDIIDAMDKKGYYLQGHAPYLSGRMLSAYLCGGPKTCHESRTGQEGLEKLRDGMFVDARESSITKNIEDIWKGIKDVRFFDHLCLCTDDREADDILHKGHMNDVVRCAIAYGCYRWFCHSYCSGFRGRG